MLEVKLTLALTTVSFLAQAASQVPLEQVLAQAPFLGILVWYLYQDGKRRSDDAYKRANHDASRDKQFFDYMNMMEDRRDAVLRSIGVECHSQQTRLQNEMTTVVRKNTEILEKAVEAAAAETVILGGVASALERLEGKLHEA